MAISTAYVTEWQFYDIPSWFTCDDCDEDLEPGRRFSVNGYRKVYLCAKCAFGYGTVIDDYLEINTNVVNVTLYNHQHIMERYPEYRKLAKL